MPERLSRILLRVRGLFAADTAVSTQLAVSSTSIVRQFLFRSGLALARGKPLRVRFRRKAVNYSALLRCAAETAASTPLRGKTQRRMSKVSLNIPRLFHV